MGLPIKTPISFKPGRGFKPNHPTRRAKSIFLHEGLSEILSSSEPVPDSVDNSEFLCPVLNQRTTSECVAHAHAAGIFASLKSKGTPLPWVPSPTGIYQIANGLQRAAYNPELNVADMPALADNGLEPHFAQLAVSTKGIVGTRSADGLSDADESTAASEADPDLFTASAVSCVLGVNLLDVLDSMRIDTLCRLLAARKFVSLALFADYSAFYDYDGSSPLGAPPPNSGSDHDVLAVDYVTDSDGQRIFRVQNSWTDGWGRGGFFDALESNAMTWSDLEVIDATIGGAP